MHRLGCRGWGCEAFLASWLGLTSCACLCCFPASWLGQHCTTAVGERALHRALQRGWGINTNLRLPVLLPVLPSAAPADPL